MQSGGCLCGAVRFEVSGELTPPDACHCSQCRKQSGHYWASTDVKRADLMVQGSDQVTWFQSSPKVRRGFCKVCGSFLFWDPPHRDSLAVAMGAFDGPTGTHLHMHIFTADKGDYYDIADGLPQNRQ
ncbi:MAG: aldehyde-activating protein [Phenylobacterium zucineum]|nr:MAG: aldehyde-activating protein [Phenylobacterium zucineum]